MKKILVIIFLMLAQMTNAQVAIVKSRALNNNDNDSLHRIANVFSSAVRDALKANYPSKVENLSVTIRENSAGLLELTYRAEIMPTDSGDSQYYFDHRGSLSSNPAPWLAIDDAKKRALAQMPKALRFFKEKYGTSITTHYDYKSAVIHDGRTWAIHENFIAAGK